MATTTRVRRGFRVTCIRCGEEETLYVELDNMTRINCNDCGKGFTTDDVRDLIARWGAALAWLESAPEVGPAAG
jgi:uncharacterized protein (DUF983 family)